MRRPGRDEDGVAVVATIALVGLLVVVAVVGAEVGGLVIAHRRVASSADLAALAAASAQEQGRDPCSAATAIAGANTGRLVGCRVLDDSSVEVIVEFRPGGLLGRADLTARSRAGPAPPGMS